MHRTAGGCVKYTDKWAERLGADGGPSEQWGDKWEERFKDGRGSKTVSAAPAEGAEGAECGSGWA